MMKIVSDKKKSILYDILVEGSKKLLNQLGYFSGEELIIIPNKEFKQINFNTVMIGSETCFTIPISKNIKFYYNLLTKSDIDFENISDGKIKIYIQPFRLIKNVKYINSMRIEDILNIYFSQYGIEFVSLKDKIVKIRISNNRFYFGEYNGIICDGTEKSIRFLVGNTSYTRVLPSLSINLIKLILNSLD